MSEFVPGWAFIRAYVAAGGLCVGVCAAACAQQTALTLETTKPAPKVFAVTRGPLESALLLYGRLEAVNSEKLVAPKTEMWSVSIRRLAEDGAKVKQGDVLVEFDNSAFVSRLSENTLALDSATTELARQEAATDATLAEKQIAFTRADIALKKAKLHASVPKDTYPLRVYQEKQLALERTTSDFVKAEVDQASARKAADLDLQIRRIAIEKTRRTLEETQRALSAMTLRAPKAGLFLLSENRRERRNYQAGDTLWPGQTVATLPDLSAYQFVAQLSDVDDGQIQVGMKARCFADAYPDNPLIGSVLALSPVAQKPAKDSNRRYFMVTVAFPNSQTHRLRPGMSARAEVLRHLTKEATVVPRATLMASAGKFQVTDVGGSIHVLAIDFCTALECAVQGKIAPGLQLRGAP